MSDTNKTREPDIPFYKRLIKAGGLPEPLKTAVVYPNDINSLQGAIRATKEGLILPILIGPEKNIFALAEQSNIDLESVEIIDTNHSKSAVQIAIKLVIEGKAEALMKGYLHTHELMHPVARSETGLRTDRWMSHVFAIDIPHDRYPKPLFLSDAAVNIFPNVEQKKDITQKAID